MLRKIGLIAAIILCVVLLKAQTITVLDRFTNNPVAQATIQELETNRGAITNAQGKADLLSFNENSTLLIRHPSYRPRKIYFKNLQDSDFNVYLTEEVIAIDEVVISVNKWEQNKIEIPQQIADFSKEKIALAETASVDLLSSSGEVFCTKKSAGRRKPND